MSSPRAARDSALLLTLLALSPDSSGATAASRLRLPAPAAQPAPSASPAVPVFGASTEMVYVRFHVTRKGSFVGDIRPDQLRVLEDGKPQTIRLLETPTMTERTRDTQVTLALDVSSSVLQTGLFDEALIREVLLGSLSERATVEVCAFGGELRCLTEPSREEAALLRAVAEARLFGGENRHQGTRLYDSLTDIAQGRPSENRLRALVVFSDGLDNKGGKVDEAISAANEANVRVYAVKVSSAYQATGPSMSGGGGGPRGGFGGGGRTMYDYRKFDLDKLAAETGGRAFEPGTLAPKRFREILREIATEITMENVIGYEPLQDAVSGTRSPEKRKRRVRVELLDSSAGKIQNGEKTILR